MASAVDVEAFAPAFVAGEKNSWVAWNRLDWPATEALAVRPLRHLERPNCRELLRQAAWTEHYRRELARLTRPRPLLGSLKAWPS